LLPDVPLSEDLLSDDPLSDVPLSEAVLPDVLLQQADLLCADDLLRPGPVRSGVRPGPVPGSVCTGLCADHVLRSEDLLLQQVLLVLFLQEDELLQHGL
jgi:hypothetical protein